MNSLVSLVRPTPRGGQNLRPSASMRRAGLVVAWFTVALGWSADRVQGREWVDASGRVKFDAELLARGEDTIVLKKADDSLIAVRIDQLSAEDQAFVRAQQDAEPLVAAATPSDPAAPVQPSLDPPSLDEFHTWTSVDGFEMRGRIIAFGRRDVEIRRTAGVVTVNGTALSRLGDFYQYLIPKIVANHADPSVQTPQDVLAWLRRQQGEPPAISVEGVLMKMEDGSELAVPFFLFSSEDLEILRPGWEQWKSDAASEADRNREDFLVRLQADQYQRQRDAETNRERIQMMQLEMMAANAGVIGIWEVLLRPLPGVFAREMSVMVPARNSGQAEQLALQRYPGFATAGVRRASR